MTPDTEIETTETEVSLEDSLRSAFEAAREPDDTGDANTQVEAPAEDAEAGPGRERDEHGRFKPKEAKEEASVEIAPANGDKPADALGTPDPYGLAPQYAGPAIKGKWADLPPEVREEITKRDREVHQQFTRYDEERNFGKQMKTVVQPYEGLIKSLGADPATAVDYLLKADYTLRTGTPDQKQAMFARIARDYGVQMGEAQEGQPQQQRDPMLETLQQRIDRLEREQNAATNAAKETEQAEISRTIEDFASRPDRPYFHQVAPLMGILMGNGQAGTLDEAYDLAVHANPETRALHLAASRETEDRKRTDATRQQAEKARRASPSVTGAPGSAVHTQLNGNASNSVEDDIRAAFQSVAGRA